MQLNTISGDFRKAKKRVGRGIGSGFGKTCGRGHKGQKSRSGGGTTIGFEGGQMPIQRRLPKFGFSSRVGRVSAQVTLSELNRCEEGEVTVDTLKALNLVTKSILNVKVMLSGEVSKKINLVGIKASKGAKAAIEAAGGSVED